jgi:hypothetical protein
VKDNFFVELDHVFDKLPKYHMDILHEFPMTKYEEKIFANQQLGMGVFTKLVMEMKLE